jgi:hypothetical protein
VLVVLEAQLVDHLEQVGSILYLILLLQQVAVVVVQIHKMPCQVVQAAAEVTFLMVVPLLLLIKVMAVVMEISLVQAIHKVVALVALVLLELMAVPIPQVMVEMELLQVFQVPQ